MELARRIRAVLATAFPDVARNLAKLGAAALASEKCSKMCFACTEYGKTS